MKHLFALTFCFVLSTQALADMPLRACVEALGRRIAVETTWPPHALVGSGDGEWIRTPLVNTLDTGGNAAHIDVYSAADGTRFRARYGSRNQIHIAPSLFQIQSGEDPREVPLANESELGQRILTFLNSKGVAVARTPSPLLQLGVSEEVVARIEAQMGEKNRLEFNKEAWHVGGAFILTRQLYEGHRIVFDANTGDLVYHLVPEEEGGLQRNMGLYRVSADGQRTLTGDDEAYYWNAESNRILSRRLDPKDPLLAIKLKAEVIGRRDGIRLDHLFYSAKADVIFAFDGEDSSFTRRYFVFDITSEEKRYEITDGGRAGHTFFAVGADGVLTEIAEGALKNQHPDLYALQYELGGPPRRESRLFEEGRIR